MRWTCATAKRGQSEPRQPLAREEHRRKGEPDAHEERPVVHVDHRGGRKDERDRRIAISAAPRFGIVGQTQTITYRLDDQGVSGERAKIVVRRDGEVISERTLASGQTANVDIDIKHAGPNIVEIEASPLDIGVAAPVAAATPAPVPAAARPAAAAAARALARGDLAR